MKKQKISSKKLRNISERKLSKSHSEGAVVELAQTSLDEKWGRFYFIHYRRSYIYLEQSMLDHGSVVKLLTKARALEVDEKTGVRFIDEKLRNELEMASADFLLHAKLGLEYFYAEVAPIIRRIEKYFNLSETKVEESNIVPCLKGIIKALQIQLSIPQSIIDILTRRDILEHPNEERLYNSENWQNVHLSWVLSGKIISSGSELVDFVNTLNESFEKYYKNYNIQGELKGVKRGVRAGEQFKFPDK